MLNHSPHVIQYRNLDKTQKMNRWKLEVPNGDSNEIRWGDRGWDGLMANSMDKNVSKQTLRDGEGQGGLVCCSLWVAESDTTRKLNNKWNSYWWFYDSFFPLVLLRYTWHIYFISFKYTSSFEAKWSCFICKFAAFFL